MPLLSPVVVEGEPAGDGEAGAMLVGLPVVVDVSLGELHAAIPNATAIKDKMKTIGRISKRGCICFLPVSKHAYALASHFVYGLTTDIVRRVVRRAF